MSFEVKNAQLGKIQDYKVTPFKIFLRDLSTNEKPAFWALDQSQALISASFLTLTKSGDHHPIWAVKVDLGWFSDVCRVIDNSKWIPLPTEIFIWNCRWPVARWLPRGGVRWGRPHQISNFNCWGFPQPAQPPHPVSESLRINRMGARGD